MSKFGRGEVIIASIHNHIPKDYFNHLPTDFRSERAIAPNNMPLGISWCHLANVPWPIDRLVVPLRVNFMQILRVSSIPSWYIASAVTTTAVLPCMDYRIFMRIIKIIKIVCGL